MDPGAIDPGGPGETYIFDVYAFVLGHDPSPQKPEGLQTVIGSFRAVALPGGPKGRFTPIGDLDQATHTVRLPALAPFNGPGAARGESIASGTLGQDLDRGAVDGLVVFSAPVMDFAGDPETFPWLYPFTANIRQFPIGKLEFTITEMDDPTRWFDHVGFFPWRDVTGRIPPDAASWVEDGQPMNGATGRIVTWGIGKILDGPEPSSLAMLLVLGGAFLARRKH